MAEGWSNWSGSVTCNPRSYLSPASEAEIATIVRRAASERQGVRICGSGHSFVPLCASDDVMLTLDNLRGIESIDAEHNEATILAGTKLQEIGEPLAAAGLAMENQGDIDKQALAGAISTGTHGTGRALGSISTQVVGMRLVTASGETFTCRQHENPELWSTLGVSLGALGVVTALTMRLLPAYRLHERTWREPIGECLERLEERIAATRHYEFFWYPAKDEAFCKSLQPTDAPPRESAGNENERIDHNYRIFPTERNNRFNEMEYAVPYEAGPDCFAAIRRLMQDKHAHVTWPVEYRTIAADELALSPNHGRLTVAISIHQAADLEHRPFFADAEPIFRAHGGRPHWGKMHNLTAAELAPLYPRWQHFCQSREKLDPAGVFLNAHLKRLFLD